MPAFVPYVPPPPSPRAMELGQRLAEAIEQYRQQHPDLNRLDVAQAARIALAQAGGSDATAPRVAIAVAAGVAAVGLAVALAVGLGVSGGRGSSPAVAMTSVAVFTALVAALLLLLLRRR